MKTKFFRMSTFKKKYGLSQKEVNCLQREGFIEIQQGGFKAHSLQHSKIVVIKQLEAFQNFLADFKEKIKKERFDVYEARIILGEMGFKLRKAEVGHICSTCGQGISGNFSSYAGLGEIYASKKVFLTIKLCKNCIKRIFAGGKVKVKIILEDRARR